jgi:sigma-B regulation protein RsbU (phosphoserine phosphatase)
MDGSAPKLTADHVLGVFRHDKFYLFLGAAFTTFGILSAAFSLLRRKFDAMLFWLALFAILYGLRLWLQLGIIELAANPSVFFYRLRDASNYLVPVPGFFYFQAAGFLGRYGRKIATALAVPFLCIFAEALLFGDNYFFGLTNNLIVIFSLIALSVESIRRRAVDKDFTIVRWGIAVFVVFALYDNISGAFRLHPFREPIGFAFFLATLGYVAAKRTLSRDQTLSELQRELEIARRIQTDILPAAYPPSDHFHVAARYVPMTSVAGDFYDFLVTDQKQAGLLIADVSGHGVPAALIASMVKLAATSQRENAADPAALLSGMNAVLCGNTQNQFVTAAYVYLDVPSATLRYSAAAHPPMLLLRAGEVVEIAENGLMLAAFSFATYATAVHPLEPGDRLVLYTDGVLEAANGEGEEFGPQRLCGLLKDSARLSAEQAADHIVSSLKRWAGSQNDDLTVLICDYTGATVFAG